MNRLSACLITLNEEHHLSRSLASLREIVDEIVIVDSGSADGTEDIARKHGAIFIKREFNGYASKEISRRRALRTNGFSCLRRTKKSAANCRQRY